MPYSTPNISFTITTRTSGYKDGRTTSAFLSLKSRQFLRISDPPTPVVVTHSTVMFLGTFGKRYDGKDLPYRKKNFAVHHNNASHSSFVTQLFFTKNSITAVPHPLYSPDSAPCDFGLFPKLKLQLKGRRFDRAGAIQTKSQTVFRHFHRSDFQKIFVSGKSPGMGAYLWGRGTTLKETAATMYKGTYSVSYGTSPVTFGWHLVLHLN